VAGNRLIGGRIDGHASSCSLELPAAERLNIDLQTGVVILNSGSKAIVINPANGFMHELNLPLAVSTLNATQHGIVGWRKLSGGDIEQQPWVIVHLRITLTHQQPELAKSVEKNVEKQAELLNDSRVIIEPGTVMAVSLPTSRFLSDVSMSKPNEILLLLTHGSDPDMLTGMSFINNQPQSQTASNPSSMAAAAAAKKKKKPRKNHAASATGQDKKKNDKIQEKETINKKESEKVSPSPVVRFEFLDQHRQELQRLITTPDGKIYVATAVGLAKINAAGGLLGARGRGGGGTVARDALKCVCMYRKRVRYGDQQRGCRGGVREPQ
jgi:hypothetical protein